ncbi:MAG TPA: hypothetical protein VEZ55_04550 [Chitinophagaceae bacterium]|nr:hypothetical protein [Chitinophagaceae bacterium]
MKPAFILLSFVFFICACTKEDPALINAVTPNEPSQINNTPPVADAGADQLVFLPIDSCILAGSHNQNDIKSVLWRKVSGPANSLISNPNLLTTKVQNLQKGIYAFELTVTNASLKKGRDTVTVTVAETTGKVEVVKGENEVTFKNLTWIYPWNAALELADIHKYVPAGKPIKVFIQRGIDTTWTEVPLHSIHSSNDIIYDYFIETRPDGAGMYTYGSLYVFFYGDNTNDKPKVKIVF